VSVFRPAAKVTSPDGREWEIYAYKIKVGDLDDFGPTEDDVVQGQADLTLLSGLVVLLVNVLLLIPRLVVRCGQVAVGALRSVRSDEWTVDAVTFMPRHVVYTWTTTSEYKGQVLAQVEGYLARGDIAQHLTNAVYRGERRSAR
jgi:hypothetical protein